MRLYLQSSPQRAFTVTQPAYVTCKVISGTARLATSEQEALAGLGLPLATSDGVVSIPVGRQGRNTEVWLAGTGAAAEVEVLLG